MDGLTMTLLVLSIALQLAAAAFALRLTRKVAGAGQAWLLIAIALALMAGRRIVTLVGSVAPEVQAIARGPVAESIGLATAALMLAGVLLVPRVLRAVQETRGDLRALEARYRALVDSAEDVIYSLDPDGRYTAINPSGLRRFCLREEEIIGKGAGVLYSSEEATHHSAQIARVLETGRPVRFERQTGDAWFHFSLSPILGPAEEVVGIAGISHDATERRQTEDELRKNARQMRTLHAASLALAQPLELDAVLEALLDYLGRLIPYDSANIMLRETGMRVAVRALRGYEGLVSAEQMPAFAFDGEVNPTIGALLTTQQSMLIADTREYPDWEERPGAEHVACWLGVPLVAGGRTIGIYSLDKVEPNSFTQEHLQLAEAMAPQAAKAIENVRLYEELRAQAAELERRVTERTSQLEARVADVETLNRAMTNLLEDLQEAKRRVGETAAQLKETNAELEAFSYSVSHDLRAPLRHIGGFVQMLLRREKERLDATSSRYLEVISQAAGRMGQLIDDLLAFSRAGREEMKLQRVEPSEMVERARQELAPVLEGRQISWQIGPLPAVQADPALLQLVWVNLLSNAIKYTAPRARARIEIGATRSEDAKGELIFFVRDNGVGFDPRYGDRLFGVFQRLHAEEEFEGTGIGLAQVRRIIHRHGGRVWAKGEVDGGAAFYFSLREAE
jgi:PAS domain S-box-containing protein